MAVYPPHALHYAGVHSGFPAPHRPRALKPYLGPHAHLSLSWLSQHFLALLLILVALGFLLAEIPSLVKEAKESLNAACSGVEGAASVAVSLPHYMAEGVNAMSVNTVNALSEGAGTVLDLMLQALEAIVLFIIDTYRSLYLCLLDLAIHGSITVLVAGIEEAQEFVTEALEGIRTAIQDSVSAANSVLNSTVGLIDEVPGVDIDVPTIDIPELSALENVTIPDTLVNALTDLNASIPTLDEFRSGLDSLISTPIEALRAKINSTLFNSSIDAGLLPVPARQSVELCQDLDTSWIDDVGGVLGKFVKIAIGLVVLAMVLLIVANALWEKYRYRVFLGGVSAAREAWLVDLLSEPGAIDTKSGSRATAEETLSTNNLLSFLNASAYPTLFRLVSRLARLLRLETSASRANLIWFLSYIAHPYAWAFLALGVVGLVVVQIQLAVLDGPVRRMTQDKATEGAGQFSTSVTGALNAKMEAASAEWANGTNKVIINVQDNINENLFGWVNDTTVALNSTMTGFYSEITDTISDLFNGTILEDPALGLIYCLVGSKVDAVSSALTWLHDHASISLPTVSPTLLQLSQNQTDELTASLTDPTSAVSAPSIADKMIDAYRRSLEQQRLGFILALGIWALVLVMGLVGAWWRAAGEQRWRRWRGVQAPSDDSRANYAERKAAAPEYDEEKRTFFRRLHLRPKADSPADISGMSTGALPVPPPAPTHPYRSGSRTENPSAASWASLIDYFKTVPPSTETQAHALEIERGDPAVNARVPDLVPPAPAPAPAPRRMRPLHLPSLSNLPVLRRSPATPIAATVTDVPSPSGPRPRLLRPYLISRPSRPLSAFRSPYDSHSVSSWTTGSNRARRGDSSIRDDASVPLQGSQADAHGERGGPGPRSTTSVRHEGLPDSYAGWRSKVMATVKPGGSGIRRSRRRRQRWAERDEHEEGWEEIQDENDNDDNVMSPRAMAAAVGVLPVLPVPTAAAMRTRGLGPAEELEPACASSRMARTLYAPSSRPPAPPPPLKPAHRFESATAARPAGEINPFATPFDGPDEV